MISVVSQKSRPAKLLRRRLAMLLKVCLPGLGLSLEAERLGLG
jgi:hypothetical protein